MPSPLPEGIVGTSDKVLAFDTETFGAVDDSDGCGVVVSGLLVDDDVLNGGSTVVVDGCWVVEVVKEVGEVVEVLDVGEAGAKVVVGL